MEKSYADKLKKEEERTKSVLSSLKPLTQRLFSHNRRFNISRRSNPLQMSMNESQGPDGNTSLNDGNPYENQQSSSPSKVILSDEYQKVRQSIMNSMAAQHKKLHMKPM